MTEEEKYKLYQQSWQRRRAMYYNYIKVRSMYHAVRAYLAAGGSLDDDKEMKDAYTYLVLEFGEDIFSDKALFNSEKIGFKIRLEDDEEL